MDEQLRLYAASEREVADLIGLGLQDDAAARRALARIELFAADDPTSEYDFADVSVRSLLWDGGTDAHGVPQPYDQGPDNYWCGLEAMVAALSYADLAPAGVSAALDLDTLYADAGAMRRPMEFTRRPDLPLGTATQFDVRVIQRADAIALAQAWLSAEGMPEDTPSADLSAFWREFLTLADRAEIAGRLAPDLWLWTPSTELLHQRFPDDAWPPAPPPERSVPVALLTGISSQTTPPPLKPLGVPSPVLPEADYAPRHDLDTALSENPGGTYTNGGGLSPDGWWTVTWRFSDGLVRVENRPLAAGVGTRYWYGMLQPSWGMALDDALRAANFPSPPELIPVADERMYAISIGGPTVIVPQSAAKTEPWIGLFRLLDSVIVTLAVDQQFSPIDGTTADPVAVAPL